MTTEVGIRYRRGQLVLIPPEESNRIGVPGDRCWLILQSEKTKEHIDAVACYLTDVLSSDGKKKRKLSTDVLIAKGTTVGKDKKMVKDSYIRCHQIYTLRADGLRLFGSIPDSLMFAVDERLRSLLALPAKLDAWQQLLLDNKLEQARRIIKK